MSYDPSKPYKKSILEIIQETWDTPYLSVQKGLYPVFKRKFSFPEVDHTDGIGSKGIYHWRARTFQNAVQDALAMNLNDLALVRAVPYKLQNHLILPEDNPNVVLQIIQCLAQECKKHNIAITGGETSIQTEEPGMELSITMSGFIKEPEENKLQAGDLLFGIQSSGLHSNGFTKVRELFREETRKEFTVPTRVYAYDILSLSERISIHGMMHITGGAFTKLKDVLGNDADVFVKRNAQLQPQEIFQEIYQRGVSDEEMYKTFNCGIGFVFSVSPEDAKNIPAQFRAFPIGEVIKGRGQITIESAFSNCYTFL